MMKKIYSLVLLGLLASTSMVCASGSEVFGDDDIKTAIGGGSLVPQSSGGGLDLGVTPAVTADDGMAGRQLSVHHEHPASSHKVELKTGFDDKDMASPQPGQTAGFPATDMTDEEKTAALLAQLAATNLGGDEDDKVVSDFDRLNALVLGLDDEGNITDESNKTSLALGRVLTALNALDSANKEEGCTMQALAAALQARTTPAEQLEYLIALFDTHKSATPTDDHADEEAADEEGSEAGEKKPAASADPVAADGDAEEDEEENEESESDADDTTGAGAQPPVTNID